MPFSNKRNQGSLERLLILGLGQGKDKMSLEHPVMPERKEVLEKEGKKAEGMSKGHRSQLERAPSGHAGTIWAINVVSDDDQSVK